MHAALQTNVHRPLKMIAPEQSLNMLILRTLMRQISHLMMIYVPYAIPPVTLMQYFATLQLIGYTANVPTEKS